jgi:DNA-binding NtrC family response regulator
MKTRCEKDCILVVDDERALADTLSAILKRAGYKSFTAYSAREALSLLQSMCPLLMISDVMMPEMNGVELAQEACKLCPGIRILLISGHAAGMTELTEAARLVGSPFELFSKPITPEELLETVAARLRGDSGEA